ncbi:uncharacterized protein LOC142353322 [Convolutriloba macropyga]|uniref:uncharacterized protein LOC142353322 n=1 Tax=Convolutriloba macropyga TaxID=536237 RepID=UPI003F5203E7
MPNDIKIEAMNNTVTALVVLSATALGFCILGCVSFCLQQITGMTRSWVQRRNTPSELLHTYRSSEDFGRGCFPTGSLDYSRMLAEDPPSYHSMDSDKPPDYQP